MASVCGRGALACHNRVILCECGSRLIDRVDGATNWAFVKSVHQDGEKCPDWFAGRSEESAARSWAGIPLSLSNESADTHSVFTVCPCLRTDSDIYSVICTSRRIFIKTPFPFVASLTSDSYDFNLLILKDYQSPADNGGQLWFGIYLWQNIQSRWPVNVPQKKSTSDKTERQTETLGGGGRTYLSGAGDVCLASGVAKSGCQHFTKCQRVRQSRLWRRSLSWVSVVTFLAVNQRNPSSMSRG